VLVAHPDWIHTLGILGLVLVFVIGTWRGINLGALSLVVAFLLAGLAVRENLAAIWQGFPVDLLILLVGVTYLFGVATANGTVERLVSAAARRVEHRRVWIPWIVFVVSALPTMAGALGSAAAALVAPIALRLAERCSLDRRLIGLMVLHGVASGNFSPLNPLGIIVVQGTARAGLEMSVAGLFVANLAYNALLGVVIFLWFGGLRLAREGIHEIPAAPPEVAPQPALRADQLCTVFALLAITLAALVFSINIGVLALTAAVVLQLLFRRTSAGGGRSIAWDVVLLVCGIVTYVALLQRYGTVDMIGDAIAALNAPLIGALLICVVGAATSAFASSAGILGAMILLAAPFMLQGGVGVTGFVIALAISSTVVDSSPFSTAGALVVANTTQSERERVYRGLLAWAGIMVLTAPLVSWLLFVVLS
jgi:Na+/H+ antiporter NhaD/arsenite permease-like protein